MTESMPQDLYGETGPTVPVTVTGSPEQSDDATTYELSGRRLLAELDHRSMEQSLDIYSIAPKERLDFALLAHSVVHHQTKQQIEAGTITETFLVPFEAYEHRLKLHFTHVAQYPGQRNAEVQKGLRVMYQLEKGDKVPEINQAVHLQKELDAKHLETANDVMFDVLAIYGSHVESLIKAQRHRKLVAREAVERALHPRYEH